MGRIMDPQCVCAPQSLEPMTMLPYTEKELCKYDEHYRLSRGCAGGIILDCSCRPGLIMRVFKSGRGRQKGWGKEKKRRERSEA